MKGPTVPPADWISKPSIASLKPKVMICRGDAVGEGHRAARQADIGAGVSRHRRDDENQRHSTKKAFAPANCSQMFNLRQQIV
jgi:hypothetical protein